MVHTANLNDTDADDADDADDASAAMNDVPSTPLIRPIPPACVGRIVAGQAITDLSSAVKELLDNAIDAGAGRVCVKLYDRGLEAIEVTDNGHGVPRSSRPHMATKHATSKLRRFDDLYDDCAPTLGFRGEALFCLANLSRSLVVSTRTVDDDEEEEELDDDRNDDHDEDRDDGRRGSSSSSSTSTSTLGTQFRFDSDGRMMTESVRRVPLSYRSGTTVAVHGLFESLPVRRVDMRKRIKAQRMKLIKMMQGYAILCLGTQFNLTDVPSTSNEDGGGGGGGKSKKGSKELIETSVTSKTLESRTASILGTKFLSGLARIEIDLSEAVRWASSSSSSSSSGASSSSSSKNDGENRWKLVGLISHAPSSPHATARDLQFFSVNGRPVELPSISKLIGDVWRVFDPVVASSTTGRRRPACVLSFTLPNNMYDVNLSPDKREVMFTEEAAMAELIKEGLMALWSDQVEGKFEANEVESRSNKNDARGGRNSNEFEALTESSKCSLSGLPPIVKANEKCGISVNENDEDFNIDYVTPKLGRRIVDEGGPLVTPLDPGSSNELADDRAEASSPLLEDSIDVKCDDESVGGSACVPPISLENTTDAMVILDSNVTISQQEGGDRINRQQSQNSWALMQLPERTREKDRRGWEQMRLNFQRIDNAKIRQDLDRILSPSDDDDEDCGQGDTLRKPSSSMGVSASSSRRPMTMNRSATNDDTSTSDKSIARRQPKRSKQLKDQDVTSFLDSFAYGSTKPAENATDSDCESQTDHDELGKKEKNDLPKALNDGKLSRGKQNIGSARMIVGKRAVEKRPRSSYRETSVDDSHESFSSTAPLRSSPPLDVQAVDRLNDKEDKTTVEVVWNSFSGTQNVINQSLNARLMMQKTRKYLQADVKRKMEGCGDDDAVANNKESTVNLCKEDFLHMSIIGQFNLGFILARCRNQDLWILDQHACDEKYNFERLCKETVIHEQKLIAPLPLELSPSEEHCVLEHMDVFERNGFRLSYDPEKEPRHRLSLTALPYSGSGGDGKKAVQFGKEDVGALCAMLGADGTSSSDGYLAGFDTGVQGSVIAGVNAVRRYAGLSSQGGTRSDGIVGSSIVRLPKAIAMFANRACRGSIMIGTALSEKEQMDILNKLDKTDVPWNCAHGRPTMSHIRSLTECLMADDDEMLSHVAGPSLSVVGDV